MSFQFYFANCSDNANLDWYYENGFNLLYSYAYNRKFTTKRLESKNATGKFMLDSGAHSAHTKGIELDMESYIEYLNENEKNIDYYIGIDKIPGVYLKPKTKKDWLEAPEISWNNYLYLRSKLNNKEKLMPVFHQGEDFKWLKKMCDYRFEDGSKIEYIGLSPRGDVSLKAKYDFSAECFGVIQASTNENIKTHALGCTSLKLLESLPYYSADSTTYLHISAYGQIWVPSNLMGLYNDSVGVKLGISVENKKHQTATQTFWEQTKEVQDKLCEYFEQIGTSVEKLSTDHKERARMSALFCKNWADNYVYKGLPTFKVERKLF